MDISVKKGHLTQTEKTHIKAILDANLKSGKIGRKTYFLSLKNDLYTVKIRQMGRGLGFIGSELKEETNTHQFTI